MSGQPRALSNFEKGGRMQRPRAGNSAMPKANVRTGKRNVVLLLIWFLPLFGEISWWTRGWRSPLLDRRPSVINFYNRGDQSKMPKAAKKQSSNNNNNNGAEIIIGGMAKSVYYRPFQGLLTSHFEHLGKSRGCKYDKYRRQFDLIRDAVIKKDPVGYRGQPRLRMLQNILGSIKASTIYKSIHLML